MRTPLSSTIAIAANSAACASVMERMRDSAQFRAHAIAERFAVDALAGELGLRGFHHHAHLLDRGVPVSASAAAMAASISASVGADGM